MGAPFTVEFRGVGKLRLRPRPDSGAWRDASRLRTAAARAVKQFVRQLSDDSIS